jgi:hypothetical protein
MQFFLAKQVMGTSSKGTHGGTSKGKERFLSSVSWETSSHGGNTSKHEEHNNTKPSTLTGEEDDENEDRHASCYKTQATMSEVSVHEIF